MTDIQHIEKLVASCGAELYDVESVNENAQKIFRVLIRAKEGVTLEKCEEISRILSPIFDLNPPISGQYYLEVSSPGIERVLKNPKHFKASIGEKVKIKLAEESLIGTLKFADDNGVEIECDDLTNRTVSYADIKKAKTFFEW